MLPSSHEVLSISEQPSSEGALLAEAFSDFIAASSRLEDSYRDLQIEVAELSQTLAERNCALHESLSENRSLGERLQRILDVVPCGVLVLAADGSIRLANPEAARLLELACASPAGHGSPLEGTSSRLPAGVVTLPGADGTEQEFSFASRNGRGWMAVRRVSLPRNGTTADPAADAVLMLSDISARKQVEKERETARDAVALAQVSALLAHEIRNPLATMELFAGLLEADPENRVEWLSHLRAGIRSLAGIVNNMLALQGHALPALESIDLDTELRAAVRFLEPLARQAEVQLSLQSFQPAWAHANRAALHQVLTNLVTNALRHTPSGGVVEVSLSAKARGEHCLRVSVSDSGCGIAPEHLPHIFKAGFSGSGSTTGLGLAVCDRLLTQMGGALTVSSRLGHGSTFTVEVPAA